MQTKNSYCLFADVISDKDRNKIKRIAFQSGYRDAITRTGAGLDKDPEIRDTKVSFSDKQYLYDLLCPYVESANESAGWNFDVNWFEPVQIARYKKNQHYSWHTDGGSDEHASYKKEGNFKGKVRKLSLVAMISNGYVGGELEFALQDRDIKPEILKPKMNVGDVVVFPSFVFHRSTPIKKGTKYSVSMWCLGPPFK